jgi:hypothetical protein
MKGNRVAIVIGMVVVATVFGTAALQAGPEGGKSKPPQDVTLSGRIVDLHCFMTEKFETEDRAKCTEECIRAGVPAALETEDGVVIIGKGTKGAAGAVAAFAYEDVELRGKLYERHGVRYIDIVSCTPVAEEEEEDWHWDDEDDE